LTTRDVISGTTTNTTLSKPTLHERTLCDTPREGTAPPHTAAPRPDRESTTARDCGMIAAGRVTESATGSRRESGTDRSNERTRTEEAR
jgi:hypothetical protein